MKWFIYALKNIFTYQGRARRAEFGWFMLTNFLVSLGIIFAFMIITFGSILTANSTQSDLLALFTGGMSMVFLIGYFIYSVVILLASISLVTRRLHDLGWSGWWQLAYFFLPFIALLAFIPFLASADDGYLTETEQMLETVGAGIYGLINIIYFVIFAILLFKDGQRKTNKYGEDPKAGSTPTETFIITPRS